MKNVFVSIAVLNFFLVSSTSFAAPHYATKCMPGNGARVAFKQKKKELRKKYGMIGIHHQSCHPCSSQATHGRYFVGEKCEMTWSPAR